VSARRPRSARRTGGFGRSLLGLVLALIIAAVVIAIVAKILITLLVIAIVVVVIGGVWMALKA
jgi:Flp pilus assembly protein TadB